MNKRNNTAEDIIKDLMTPVGEKMERPIENIAVLRFIQYFPKGGNQRKRKLLCYNRNGYVSECYEATYADASILRSKLYKLHITVTEDYCYMQKKDFDYYSEKELP